MILFIKHQKQIHLTKQEIENEIKKTDAHDILDSSPNSNTISTSINNERKDFRERVRHRLNQNVHRSRSESNGSNSPGIS